MQNISKFTFFILSMFLTISSEAKQTDLEKQLKTQGKYTNATMKNGKISLESHKLDSNDMLPSWWKCKSSPLYSEDYWLFLCDDCELTFEVEIDPVSYDLHTSSHTGTYPKLQLLNATEGVPIAVGSSFVLDYRAPEIAAIYNIKVNWSFPNASPPIPDLNTTVTINVFVPGLVDATSAGIIFTNITSHPDNGTYLMPYTALALSTVVPVYQTLAVAAGVPSGPPIQQYILTPTSEGASLNYGGLFDTRTDFSNPHCTHRDGHDIDIGMSQYKASPYKTELMGALDYAIQLAGFSYPAAHESPDATAAQQAQSGYHWHLRYPGGF